MAKVKIGTGKCQICNELIVWKKSDSGALSATCAHCDFQVYAPVHSDAAKAVNSWFGAAKPEAEPEATPAADVKQAMQPPPKPAVNMWGLPV